MKNDTNPYVLGIILAVVEIAATVLFSAFFAVVFLSVLFGRTFAHKTNGPMSRTSKLKLIAVYIPLAGIAYFVLKGLTLAAIPVLAISLVIYAIVIYLLLSFGSWLVTRQSKKESSQ